jgi:hypothetical protein
MSILVIAPTLKTPSGHDHAFCTELIQCGGDSDVRILASDQFQPEPGLPAQPFFSVDPYAYRWIHCEAKKSLPWRTLLGSAVRDLSKIDFASYDRLIFHTADPIYLTALSRCLARFRGTFYLGFTLPPSFWLRETVARRIVSLVSDLAIGSVRRKARLVLYSETGAVRFDHRAIKCHLKLGPVESVEYGSLPDPQKIEMRDSRDPIKIGFFGAPLDDKGFRILLELAECEQIQSRFQIRIFLPPGQQELADKINAGHDVVRASSESRDVPTYFSCVSSVDLVYTLYSPLAYKDRMSGIVQDAILAGKPLLITSPCTEMRRFIDRVAPGAYVHSDYSVVGAMKSLVSAIDDVDGLLRKAKKGTETIRKLKTFEAFFDSGKG